MLSDLYCEVTCVITSWSIDDVIEITEAVPVISSQYDYANRHHPVNIHSYYLMIRNNQPIECTPLHLI